MKNHMLIQYFSISLVSIAYTNINEILSFNRLYDEFKKYLTTIPDFKYRIETRFTYFLLLLYSGRTILLIFTTDYLFTCDQQPRWDFVLSFFQFLNNNNKQLFFVNIFHVNILHFISKSSFSYSY